MADRRFVNASQPQTLQIAIFLLYVNAFFTLLYGGFRNPVGLLLIVAQVAAGYGIANEWKWGYGLGVAMAFFPFLYRLIFLGGVDALLGGNLLNLMFEIALVALLLHPHSRDYQRLWFK